MCEFCSWKEQSWGGKPLAIFAFKVAVLTRLLEKSVLF